MSDEFERERLQQGAEARQRPNAPSPGKVARPRRFSLRTLFIVITILCVAFAFLGHELADSWRQKSIAAQWTSNYGVIPFNRSLRHDVVWLTIDRNPNFDDLPSLAPLVHLKSIVVKPGVTLTKSQYSKLFDAFSLERLELPPTCSDDDLEGIERLVNLKELVINHRDRPFTVRRLRNHPKLLYAGSFNDGMNTQEPNPIFNDYATWHSTFALERSHKMTWRGMVTEEFLSERSIHELPARNGRFNIAVFGSERSRLFDALSDKLPRNCSAETNFAVLRRNEVDYYLTSAISLQDGNPLDSQLKKTIEEFKIIARTAAMADRAIIAIDPLHGVTENDLAQCKWIRGMKTPSWVFFAISDEPVSPGRLKELSDQLTSEIGKPPAFAGTYSASSRADPWDGVTLDISLRPPAMKGWTGLAAGFPSTIAYVRPQFALNQSDLNMKYQWSVAFAGAWKLESRQGTIKLPEGLLDFEIGWLDDLPSLGDDVAILRNGEVVGTGVVEKIDPIK